MISFDRRSGNSTRLLDYYVQKLFQDGEVKISDHHPTRQASELLYKHFLRRLNIEHNLTDKDIYFNNSNLLVKLKF